MKIELTRLERQLLANQNRILACLIPEDAGSYNANVEILTRGFEFNYGDVFNVFPDDQVKTYEVCEETIDILSMFRSIHNAIAGLGENQLEQINVPKLRFHGFDANDTEGHYYYGQFMVETLNKWDELGGRMINSHTSSSILQYREMLKKLSELGKGIHDDLTFEDLQELSQ